MINTITRVVLELLAYATIAVVVVSLAWYGVDKYVIPDEGGDKDE